MAFRTNKTPDLQEKSASGSIATFNTALAMPLVNGEFTIQAYQEGSGDPSPENIRNIIGYSELNIYKTGKNLFGDLTFANSLNGITTDYNLDTTNKIVSFSHSTRSDSGSYVRPIFNNFKSNTRYTFIFYAKTRNEGVSSSNIRIGYIDGGNSTIPVNSSERNLYIYTTPVNKSVKDLTIAYNNNALIDVYYDTFGVFEGIVTIDDFEAYNGEVKTKQLGEEIVGGSYNSATGDKEKTWTKELIKDLDIGYISQNNYFYILNAKKNGMSNLMSDVLKFDNSAVGSMSNYSLKGNGNNSNIYIKATDYTTVEELKEALGDYHIAYEMIEPIESNIGATPIETYDRSNNIFCDTGDSSVTYKDLDIAKRGSFREVFKLPS